MDGRVFPSLDNPPFRGFVYFNPFPNLLLFYDCFLNFLFSFSEKWSQTLFMLELKQPYYDHLVIQSNKSLNCLRDGTLCEQVVDKRVLRRQTKKRPILCFDLFCARKSIENTSVERKAKESSQMSGLNIFFSTLIQTESTSYGPLS